MGITGTPTLIVKIADAEGFKIQADIIVEDAVGRNPENRIACFGREARFNLGHDTLDIDRNRTGTPGIIGECDGLFDRKWSLYSPLRTRLGEDNV